MPGGYTVTEMSYDKYEPQESRRVTVVSGQVSTVNFNNKLKRGDLHIIKSSEDSRGQKTRTDREIQEKRHGAVDALNELLIRFTH